MAKKKSAQRSGKAKKAAPKKSASSKPLSLKHFEKLRKPGKTPKVKRITAANLTRHVSKLTAKETFSVDLMLELTARHPYDAAGLMDFYKPGRWDCTSDLVFMDVIVTGPEPGEWDGTVGYVQFTAPSADLYVVVTNFSGYQITMSQYGPWGVDSAYNATNATSASVLSLWSGAAGEGLFFNVSCTGPIIGYLESIQIFRITF
jgi:hypothetical protein